MTTENQTKHTPLTVALYEEAMAAIEDGELDAGLDSLKRLRPAIDSHDALVSALKECRDALDALSGQKGDYLGTCDAAREQATEALTLAGEL